MRPHRHQSELELLLVQFTFLAVCFESKAVGRSLWLFLAFGVVRGGVKSRGRGYVSSLSGLLTGLPPFMTTGSLVVLFEGGPPASLGTASPTSCNEGSRYIATRGGEGEKRTMVGGDEEGWRR